MDTKDFLLRGRGLVIPGSLSIIALVGLGLPGCGSKGSAGLFDADDSATYSSAEWVFSNSKGVKLTSEHYILYTTCTHKPFVNALPGFLESCWQAYAELLPSETKPDRKLEVYLFQARWQWERFTEQFNPERAEIYKRIRSGGYSERGLTVSHYSTQRASLSVLAHEGLHQYLELTRGTNVPPWLSEGLATYFEAFDVESKTNRPLFKPTTNYLRTSSLREAVQSGGLLPMERMLSTHAGLEVQERIGHVRTYYAQIWSMILFLMRTDQDNLYLDGFRQLLREAGTETMDRKARAFLATDTEGRMSYGEAVFRAYVSDDLETFRAQYEAYLHKLLRMPA